MNVAISKMAASKVAKIAYLVREVEVTAVERCV